MNDYQCASGTAQRSVQCTVRTIGASEGDMCFIEVPLPLPYRWRMAVVRETSTLDQCLVNT